MPERDLCTREFVNLKDGVFDDAFVRHLEGIEGIKGPIKYSVYQYSDDTVKIVFFDQESISEGYMDSTFEFIDALDVRLANCQIDNETFYRPLIYCSFRHVNEDHLGGGILEMHPLLRGNGSSRHFLDNLKRIACDWGYRHIGGTHSNSKIARSFCNAGAFLLDQIKPEYREYFQRLINAFPDAETFYSIFFLYPEDAKKYVRKERLDTSPEDKVIHAEKLKVLSSVLDLMKPRCDVFPLVEGCFNEMAQALGHDYLWLTEDNNVPLDRLRRLEIALDSARDRT